jgi:phosphoribosylamine---glycine ligase
LTNPGECHYFNAFFMKLLVLGSGGREHALAWKLRESQLTDDIYCAPGNAGIAQEAECLPVDLSNPEAVLELANPLRPDLTVVGPEVPLAAGVVDAFEKAGLGILGPTRAAARFESSKAFAKEFMQRQRIPTARFRVVDNLEAAVQALDEFVLPTVIKADGLAAGKGVVVAHTREEAEGTIEDFMRHRTLGSAGSRVVIEDQLLGEEVSFIILTDGQTVLTLPPSQDHKALLDDDRGPNTGGMGACSDDSMITAGLRSEILRRIVNPTLAGMMAEGFAYRGFLYFGLMLTKVGPMLLEYNVRLGDPEAQAILVRLRSDLVQLLVSAREGSLAARDPHWSPSPAVCVVLASEGYPGKPELGKLITGYELAEQLGGVKVFHAGTAVQDHKLVTTGGRVLGVTAMGENLPAAVQRAYSAAAKIQFEGMQYRHDIGAKRLKQGPSLASSNGAIEMRSGGQGSSKHC